MSSDNETITMSNIEFKNAIKLAEQGKSLEILIGDFKSNREALNKDIASIMSKMDAMPDKIKATATKLESDISNNYVTHEELKGMKQSIIAWVGGFSCAIMIFQYVITNTNLLTH